MTAARMHDVTLVANTGQTVTLDASYQEVDVTIVTAASGVDDVWVRADGVLPTVGGDNCENLNGYDGASVTIRTNRSDPTTVGVISAQAHTIQVRGVT